MNRKRIIQSFKALKTGDFSYLERLLIGTGLNTKEMSRLLDKLWPVFVTFAHKHLSVYQDNPEEVSKSKRPGPYYIPCSHIHPHQRFVQDGDFGLVSLWLNLPEVKEICQSMEHAVALYSWLISIYPRWQVFKYWSKLRILPIAISEAKCQELMRVPLPKGYPIRNMKLMDSVICIDNGDTILVTGCETYRNNEYVMDYRINYTCWAKPEDSVFFDIALDSTTKELTIDELLQKYVDEKEDQEACSLSIKYAIAAVNILGLMFSAKNIEFKPEEFNENRILKPGERKNNAKLNKHESFMFVNIDNPSRYTAMEKKGTNLESESGITKSEHFRSAHWHTYRCGPGKKEVVIYWIDTLLINPGVQGNTVRFKTVN